MYPPRGASSTRKEASELHDVTGWASWLKPSAITLRPNGSAYRDVVRIRDLGPLQVEVDGKPQAFAGARQHGILSILAISANRRMSADEIIATVWGAEVSVSTSVLENQIGGCAEPSA